MQQHPLVCYFLMAYGFSWIAWIPYVLSLDGLGLLPIHLTQFGLLPGAFLGPFLSGFLMTASTEGKPGVGRLLRRFVLWRVGWQCWHLPLYLTTWGNGAGWLEICVAVIGNIGLTIVITWVFNHTRGSLLLAILMHATLDAFGVTSATSIFSMQ